MQQIDARRIGVVGVALAGFALVGASGPAYAGEGSGPTSPRAQTPAVVVSPKPGQRVKRHPVRFVVRAGPETGDLRARLNGVAIGRHFLVQRRGRRVLSVSSSHGLRHGRNVLKVVARTHRGTRVRRSKVRFTVAHRRPLSGAGRDRRIVRGSRIKLNGRVREHPRGPSGDPVRWKIVDVPRRSRLLRRSASKSASAKQPGLRAPTSLRAGIKPDVNGTYTLKMTAGSGAGATTDRVDLHAVPDTPMVQVHTRVAPGPDEAEGRPAIQVWNKTYVAPFLSEEGGTGSYYGGEFVDVDSPEYQALFQVLILDRTTLEYVANVTYGVCLTPPGSGVRSWKTCRSVDDGKPVISDLGEDLVDAGQDPTKSALIIVNSLPAAETTQLFAEFAHDHMVQHALTDLSKIGFPDGHRLEDVSATGSVDIEKQLDAAPADSLSVIGVPGMKPGEADFAVIPEAVSQPARGMNGWLMPDQNAPAHYQFVAPDRVPFATRAKPDSCDDAGCTVTVQIGDQTLTRKVESGFASFLAAAYEPHTLERQALDYFVTGSPAGSHSANAGPRAAAMAAFLKQWGDAGSVIVISSIHTPGSQPSHLADHGIDAGVWAGLAAQVAGVGGTLHGFNAAASTADSDYTLIGFGGAGEGGGQEAIGKHAGVSGVLARNSESLFRPANATDNGTPSELLVNEVFKPPGEKPWPYADDRGVSAAISYIGARISMLGPDPRAAYWTKLNSAEKAMEARGDVDAFPAPIDQLAPPTGPKPLGNLFTRDEFFTARAQLSDELRLVAHVRTYLGDLAAPTAQSGDPWPTTLELGASLKGDLESAQVKAQGERKFDVFEVLASFFDIASLGAGAVEESAEKALYAVAAGLEFAANLQADQDGSEPEDPSVGAAKAAQQLHDRMENVSNTFVAIGDIIVSDYSKLELIGTYGGCNLDQGECPDGLTELASPDGATAKAMAKLAVERSVHEMVVPYYYPIANLDLSYSCKSKPNFDPNPCAPDNGPDPYTQYYCAGNPLHPDAPPPDGGPTPFGNGEDNIAPKEAWVQSLERLDPRSTDPALGPSNNLFRTWITTARLDSDPDADLYTWPKATLLEHMFSPVALNNNIADSPLGISARDWMREAWVEPDPLGPDDVCGFWAGQA